MPNPWIRNVIGAGLVGMAALMVAPGGAAWASDACIAAKVVEAQTVCPSAMVAPSGKRRGLTLTSAPNAGVKKTADPSRPPPPTEMTAVQRRRAAATPRETQLLVAEIQGMLSLLTNTPRTAPDRAKILRRIADDFVELESSAMRLEVESNASADAARRKKDAKSEARLRAVAKRAASTIVGARGEAIKHYTMLKEQHPRFCTSGSSGCVDEVLYHLAFEYEADKKPDKARAIYLELIQRHPTSKYLPKAYLAFGDLFFDEAMGDPSKWALAEQAYREVIKYPPPDNVMFGYAQYKLGYVHWNRGEHALAMSQLKKTIEFGTGYPKLPNAEALTAAARRDIVPIYALSGDPRKAYDFFRPISGDGGDGLRTYKMMDDLGQAYLDTGHYTEAIALYQDLLKRDHGAGRCGYQGHIAEATLALKSGDKKAIMSELLRQLETHDAYAAEQHTEARKVACANLTAQLVAETAMMWHLEAVGSDGVRGTADKKTMDLAADLYDRVLARFGKEQFAKFTFPRLVKEDWPTADKLAYARADLLYFNKDWDKCGPAFDAVVRSDPKGPMAAEAGYASAVCYQNVYLKAHENGRDRALSGNLPGVSTPREASQGSARSAPKPLSESEKSMLASFSRFRCQAAASSDKSAVTRDRLVEIKYAAARTYFEAQHWEEAAIGFRDVALNHADHDAGVHAAELYLEALNLLTYGESPREACLDDMAKDTAAFLGRYCQGGRSSDECARLSRVDLHLERKRIERMVAAAAEKGAAAPAELEKGALAYMDIWNTRGRAVCEAKQPACERMEEVLYNAAQAFQAARLVAKAIAVRKILVDPRFGLEKTALGRKAIFEIGGNYQAIAVYDEAASFYERFARESPKTSEAPQALRDAVVLRLGTGDDVGAEKDAEQFSRTFGRKEPAQAAHVSFALAAHYAAREDWGLVKRRLSAAMRGIDDGAALDVRIQAHALLGRALSRTGDRGAAAREYDHVRALTKDRSSVRSKLDALGGDESEKARRIGKALLGVGEAAFFFADEQRRTVDAIRFPEYRGSGERDEVLRFVDTRVAEWVKRKKPAIERAEKEFLAVLEIDPIPPPWAIAAGARVGQMWGRFVAEFRAAPIPKEWLQSGRSPYGDLTWEQIRAAYYEALDRASEPLRQRAKVANEACLRYSVKYQHFDEHSRGCEVWLSKNYGSEYRLFDELRGAPTRVASGLDQRPAPMLLASKPN